MACSKKGSGQTFPSKVPKISHTYTHVHTQCREAPAHLALPIRAGRRGGHFHRGSRIVKAHSPVGTAKGASAVAAAFGAPQEGAAPLPALKLLAHLCSVLVDL